MPSSCRLIFRVSFGHAFFSDGVLRDLRIVPVPACFDKLRRAGLLLRQQEDGIAVYGDDRAIERLKLHIQAAGRPLAMAFQVFFTNPLFYEYTAPAWPTGKLLFVESAQAVADASGHLVMHASPYVEASAFLGRDHARLVRILGERILAPTPAMVFQVDVGARLLDLVDARQRHFHVRFDAAANQWIDKAMPGDSKQGGGDDPAAEGRSRHFAGANIGDRRRAHVFPSKGAILMREVSPPRIRLRAPSPTPGKPMPERAATSPPA